VSLAGHLRHFKRVLQIEPRRYRYLLTTVYRLRPRTIVEIGTYNGAHAVQMIETASLFRPVSEIEYYGFDLFEALTARDLKAEFSKVPPPQKEVLPNLEATGARVELFQGYTHETLPRFVEQAAARGLRPDFVFIDGGHAIETIRSDFRHLEKLLGRESVVLFDDYYTNDPEEVRGLGCQSLIDALDRERYRVRVLGTEDRFPKEWGTLQVRMARVRLSGARGEG
jgi:predicted O-methyltransferase YrrM